MADDLRAVVWATPGPVILVGHSIGRMINLTFADRYPDLLGSKVKRIVVMNSTYTNPTSTKRGRCRAGAAKACCGTDSARGHGDFAFGPRLECASVLLRHVALAELDAELCWNPKGGHVDFVSR